MANPISAGDVLVLCKHENCKYDFKHKQQFTHSQTYRHNQQLTHLHTDANKHSTLHERRNNNVHTHKHISIQLIRTRSEII